MAYDFTTKVDRTGCGAAKWEGMFASCPDVPKGIVPFSVADMEFVEAPQVREAIRGVADTVLGYTEPTSAYYDAVVGWMKRRHNWDVEKDWIVTSPGVVPALYWMVKAFTEPGEGVIIQSPVYYPFKMSIENTGRTVVENPLTLVDDGTANEHYEMDFDDLEKKAADPNAKMIILCSPHNPVGRVWTADELRQAIDICLAHDLIVVCDEIHNDLILPGHEHTVSATVVPADKLDRVVVCTAPSKTFNLAGLQCSNIFIPGKELRERYIKVAMTENGLMGLNAFAYPVCAAVYNGAEDWLDELRDVLATNHQLFVDMLGERAPKAHVFELEGTYLQWVDFRYLGMSNEELEKFMHEKAYLFLDEGYLFGEAGSGFERFNIACPTEVLREALTRLCDALDELGKE
ncbi:MAG: pyridoxal phosphate-dependent aminotransferase [Coriobacteriia bacterium]|nr:pyridoxal phosphate-dependent aminotransferase [Coriobacteriia bacterium]MBS5477238.1 pyridoxal phosphate-dependent aminotransferase [Coriobacteriia bacterium]